jgi:hypothetical protein
MEKLFDGKQVERWQGSVPPLVASGRGCAPSAHRERLTSGRDADPNDAKRALDGSRATWCGVETCFAVPVDWVLRWGRGCGLTAFTVDLVARVTPVFRQVPPGGGRGVPFVGIRVGRRGHGLRHRARRWLDPTWIWFQQG